MAFCSIAIITIMALDYKMGSDNFLKNKHYSVALLLLES